MAKMHFFETTFSMSVKSFCLTLRFSTMASMTRSDSDKLTSANSVANLRLERAASTYWD